MGLESINRRVYLMGVIRICRIRKEKLYLILYTNGEIKGKPLVELISKTTTYYN